MYATQTAVAHTCVTIVVTRIDAAKSGERSLPARTALSAASVTTLGAIFSWYFGRVLT